MKKIVIGGFLAISLFFSVNLVYAASPKMSNLKVGFNLYNNEYYYKDFEGKLAKGFKTIDGVLRYFDDKDGHMYYGVHNIEGKLYYFDPNGEYVPDASFNKNGSLKHGFYKEKDGTRYYENGIMKKGVINIDGHNYYFNEDTGLKGDYEAYIKEKENSNEDEPIILKDDEDVRDNNIVLSSYYDKDKIVDDRLLLAALIYCEANTQRETKLLTNNNDEVYKGHIAVAYVIANRKNDSMTIRQLVYKKNQFEPAGDGKLGRIIETPEIIPDVCFKAADVCLALINDGKESVPEFLNENFKYHNFWGLKYAKERTNFFKVYKKSDYKIIEDHVFFNYSMKLRSK